MNIKSIIKWINISYPDEKHIDETLNIISQHAIVFYGNNDRIITKQDETLFKRSIQYFPRSKRVKLITLYHLIVEYYFTVLNWTIPTKSKEAFKDKQNITYQRIQQYQFVNKTLASACQKLVLKKLDINKALSPEEMILLLMFDTAPLNLTDLLELINKNVLIEHVIPQTVLLKNGTLNAEQYARYRLGPITACALSAYRLENSAMPKLNKKNLTKKLLVLANNLIGNDAFQSFQQLHDTTLCFWQNKIGFWATYQLARPSTQSSISTERWLTLNQTIRSLPSNISKLDAFKPLNLTQKNNETETKPNKVIKEALTFINRGEKKNAEKLLLSHIDDIDEHDITEHLLVNYLYSLVKHGGIIRRNLAKMTFTKYLSIVTLIKSMPLPLKNCIDSEDLNLWAEKILLSVTGETFLEYIQLFFKYLSTHVITENISLEKLLSPLEPIKVNANHITNIEYDLIIKALSRQRGDIYQTRCAQVAATLGYYGMLRRGEVIRLRVQDIIIKGDGEDEEIVRLIITNTKEGNTKTGQSRIVHVNLPDDVNSWLLYLHNKAKLNGEDSPLIGHVDESISTRALRYILPVTRTLKMITNDESIRFHHLRHTGAMLYIFQLLSFINPNANIPAPYSSNTHQFDDDYIQTRISRWLLDTPDKNVNVQIIIDQFLQEIGHSDLSTSRMHYLHGCDWLIDLCLYDPEEFSDDIIRILHGFTKGSTNIHGIKKNLKIEDGKNNNIILTRQRLCQMTQSTRHNKYKKIQTKIISIALHKKQPAKRPFIQWYNKTHRELINIYQNNRIENEIRISEEYLNIIESMPNFIKQITWPTQRQTNAILDVFSGINNLTLGIKISINKRTAKKWEHIIEWFPRLRSQLIFEIHFNKKKPVLTKNNLINLLNINPNNIHLKKTDSAKLPECFIRLSVHKQHSDKINIFLVYLLPTLNKG